MFNKLFKNANDRAYERGYKQGRNGNTISDSLSNMFGGMLQNPKEYRIEKKGFREGKKRRGY